jgi:hypothetical protein
MGSNQYRVVYRPFFVDMTDFSNYICASDPSRQIAQAGLAHQKGLVRPLSWTTIFVFCTGMLVRPKVTHGFILDPKS